MRIISPRPSHVKTSGFTLIELLVVIAIIAILASLLIPALGRAKDKGRTARCQSNLRQLAMAATMFDQDQGVFPIGWPPPEMATQRPTPIWYRQLQPYVGRTEKVAGQGVFVCPSSLQKAKQGEKNQGSFREGGFWGYLAYAQNYQINSAQQNIGSSHVKDPSSTILYADTDGWDACLYPDGVAGANVCYRHSGGNERSSETNRGLTGRKEPKRRANAVFADSHVEIIRSAPRRLFTLEMD